MVDIDVCVSRYLKEELAWAVDKHPSGYLFIFKTVRVLRDYKGTKE